LLISVADIADIDPEQRRLALTDPPRLLPNWYHRRAVLHGSANTESEAFPAANARTHPASAAKALEPTMPMPMKHGGAAAPA
jgi:hypothetical protein